MIKHRNIFFTTYGSSKFKESRERIIEEAKKFKIFKKTILETEETILIDDEFQEALSYKKFSNVFNNRKMRGGGCYLWKPYVVYKNYFKIKNGDFLVFADAGCRFNNSKKNVFKFYIEKLNESNEKGILKRKSNHTEGELTDKRYFEHFEMNAEQYENHHRNPVFSIFIKKCNHSDILIKKYWETAKKFPELFEITAPNNQPQGDTAVFSLLCHKFGAVECPWIPWSKNEPYSNKFKTELPIVPTRIRK